MARGMGNLDTSLFSEISGYAKAMGRKATIERYGDRLNRNVIASVLSVVGVGKHSPERVAKDRALLAKQGIRLPRQRSSK